MLGVFGGTFDPIHYGHLRTCLEVKEIFALKEVRLIPCSTPPHRTEPQVSAKMRLEMLQLALAKENALICDARELNRSGASYTVDTLKSLREDFPKEPLLLFIGSDAFNGLSHWHQYQCLFSFAHIVVLTRPAYENQLLDDFFAARLAAHKEELASSIAGKLFFQSVTQLDISATAIRTMLREKRSPRFLLPDTVIDYIQQHSLYQANDFIKP